MSATDSDLVIAARVAYAMIAARRPGLGVSRASRLRLLNSLTWW